MSAFVCEDRTFNIIVTYLAMESDGFNRRKLEELGFKFDTADDRQKIAANLFQLNVLAVGQRYGKGKACEFRTLEYRFQFDYRTTQVEVYKAMHCLIYQCSEGAVIQMPLFAVLKEITASVGHDIISKLPEYDKATWG